MSAHAGQTAEWFLPNLPAYKGYAGNAQPLGVMCDLITHKKVRRPYPVGKLGVGVKRSDEFPELEEYFRENAITISPVEEEIPFPAEAILDLRELLGEDAEISPFIFIKGREKIPYPAHSEAPLPPPPIENQPPKRRAVVLRPKYQTPQPLPPPPPPPRKKGKPFASWDEESRKEAATLGFHGPSPEEIEEALPPLPIEEPTEDMLAKEWWLPPIPAFGNRAKFPQSLINIQKLIEKGLLRSEHPLRKEGTDFFPAGSFLELTPFFREVNPDFNELPQDPFPESAMREWEGSGKEENPQALASYQASSNMGWVNTDTARANPEFEGHLPPRIYQRSVIAAQNMVPRCARAGFAAGCILSVPFVLLGLMGVGVASAFASSRWEEAGMLVEVFATWVGVVTGCMIVAHALGGISHYLEDSEWSLLQGFFVGGVSMTLYTMFYMPFEPQIAILSFFSGAMALVKLLFAGLKGSIAGVVVVLLDRKLRKGRLAEYSYGAPLDSTGKVWTVGMVLILSLGIGFRVNDILTRMEGVHTINEVVDNSKGLDVSDLLGLSDVENLSRYNVSGMIRNTSRYPRNNWFVDIILKTADGKVIARGRIQNKRFTTLKEQKMYTGSMWLPYGKSVILEEGSTSIEAGETFAFNVIFTNLDEIPDMVETSLANDWDMPFKSLFGPKSDNEREDEEE